MTSHNRVGLLLLCALVVLPVAIAVAYDCPAPPSGNLGRGRYQEWCIGIGGKLVDLGGGSMRCDCGSRSSSSASSSTAANPYTPLVEEFLKFWFMPGSMNNAEKQRRAAMMRELEAQREQARRNQQQAQAARLDAILQRLTSSDGLALKGGGGNALRLKLGGPQRPLGMEVYQHPDDGKKRMGISGLSGINLDNETPTTTRAQLTLKIGDDATRSLQTPAPAPAPASTPPAPPAEAAPPQPAESAEQAAAEAQVDELARAISQLSPEEQQKLIAALRGESAATPAAGASASAANPNAALSLKLRGAQAEADALKAAADSGASPEELSKKAADQFRNLQGVTAERVKIGQSDAPAGSPAPNPPSTATREPQQPPAPDCKPGASDGSVVDLRCAKQPLVVDPAKVQPDEVPRPARVQSPVADDLKLLFLNDSRWPGPRRPDEPFRNPLREEEIRQIEAQLRKRNAEAAVATLYVVTMGKEVTPLHRERLVFHFLTPEQRLRYDTNAEFRARVDQTIDSTVREVKKNWAAQDLKALDEAGQSMLPVLQRLYPQGLPQGNLSPEFIAEQDRRVAELNRKTIENAKAAPVELMIRLDLAFMGLK